MTEQQEVNNEQLPFNIGELVKMRSKDLYLVKFNHLPKEDIGIVVDVKKSEKDQNIWLVFVHWQKYRTKSGKDPSYMSKRLKRANRKRKDNSNEL